MPILVEVLIGAAVLGALLIDLVPRLAAAVEHALFMAFVTVAAWPMYLALSWRQRLAPPGAHR